MMALPEFDADGDLPPGVYAVTLPEVLARFGHGSPQRRVVAGRLAYLYHLSASTGQVARFVVFGSFVTAKTDPRDVDVVLIMDITTARKVVNVSEDRVSSFYVEMTDPTKNDAISQLIETAHPNVDARSMGEFLANFSVLMGQLDLFLLMTVSLALLVGVVGIVNTMLMSTTERFVEFGVLRTNGWSQRNVLTLVTAESAFLGLLSGLVGCVLATLGAFVANQFISGGLQLKVTPGLFLLGTGLSVITGVLGGLYPAWRAARLVPMDAIRLGSH